MPELAKKEEKQYPLYNPSDREQEIIGAIWGKWQTAQDQRLQAYRHFNDRTFVEYVNDSVDRFNGYIPPREDPAADWGAHVFNPVTRNKTVSIVAQITAERVRAEFFAQNQEDEDDARTAELIKQVEDFTYYKNRDDEQQFYATLEAAVKGTVIGYEGYKVDKRKVKEITSYDPDTGEVKWEEKEIEDWNDVYGEVIPLFDFYPGNIYVRELQKQPFCIWRSVVDFDLFTAEFEKYKNAKYVQPANMMMQQESEDVSKQTQVDTGDTQTTGYITSGVGENDVEIIRYFNKWTDEFHILANGVLLTKSVSPLPWDHKDYPFWKSIFEPFAIDFFYGKSLPDKLKSNQDVLNTLYRMMLDQSYLSINPPMLTQGVENIRDELLYPGRRIPVDDVPNTKVMEIPAPNQAHFQIIKMVEENLNKASIDDPSAGIAGSRTTAFEVGVAKEAAQKLLTLFLRTLEWGVRDKTELRVKNILQFYRLPKIKDITDEEGALEYRRIVMDDETLADGTRGRQILQVAGSQAELPSPEQITGQELYYLAKGQNVAFSYITVDKLKDIDLKVKIIPNSSLKMSEALRRALELDFQQKAALLFPDLINREEAAKEFIRTFDKNPDKFMNQGGAAMTQVPGATPPGGVQPNEAPASGPNIATPNSAATAGMPTANTTQNSTRNIPA